MSGHQRHHHQRLHFSVAPPSPIPVPRLYPPFSPAPASTLPSPLPPRPPPSATTSPPAPPPPPPPPFSSSSFPSAPFTPSFRSSAPPPSLCPSSPSLSSSPSSSSCSPSFPSPPPDSHFPRFLSLQTLPLPLSAPSLLRPLAAKSALLTLVYLLRFHALRYCSAGASILADLAGALAAKSLSDDPRAFAGPPSARHDRRISGFAALLVAVSLLSFSWDRSSCFPLSSSPPPTEGCVRVAPMLLPFVPRASRRQLTFAEAIGSETSSAFDSRPRCCYPLRSDSG